MTYEIPEAGRIDETLCRRLDAADPLAVWRNEFVLPDGIIYLDGNSLGPLPKTAAARINRVVNEEWGHGLIRSWNDAGWIDAPRRLGAKIAPLLGVDADEVVVADSTSVNLFKLLVAAMRLRADRQIVLTELGNFPTDIYVARGVERLLEHATFKMVPHGSLVDAVDDAVAVVLLTHVDYKTSRMHDLKSEAMSELFIRAIEGQLDSSSVQLASPRDMAMRGSHVSFRHPAGHAVVQALIDRNVIGDFRAPDLMRFGFAPLYLTFANVWRATSTLVQVIENRSWDRPRLHQRRAVT